MPADEKLFEGGETVDACICGFKNADKSRGVPDSVNSLIECV